MKKHHLLVVIAAGFLLGGCAERSTANQDAVGDRKQPGIGWNGIGWNGIGWNGIGWNGIGWNGIGWNGIGWNGIGWNGIGWNGTSFTNTLPPSQWGSDWGLDAFINLRDADGSGGPLTPADRQAGLDGLAYWAQCACASTDILPWTGNNPYPTPHNETLYFQGSLNLAPNWCTGSGPVPLDELQMVSACIFARINTLGIHNALSLRGYDPSLQLIDNEKLFMAYAESQHSGNLWDTSTSVQYGPHWYSNPGAYTCHYPWGNGSWQLAHDLALIVGRDCPWTGCSGHMKTTLGCFQGATVDGSTWMAYSDAALTTPMGAMNDPPVLTPAIGPNNSSLNGYQDNFTGAKYVTWRGKQKRQISVYLGAWADLEVENWKQPGYRCDDVCPPSDGCGCYDNYCGGGSGEPPGGGGQALMCERPSDCNNCGTIVWHPGAGCGTSAACMPGTACVRGRKLTSLPCWLQINFMRPYDLLTNAWVSGTANTHKAGSLIIRYSNGDAAMQPGNIMIRDNIRNIPIPHPPFPPTGGWDNYDNHIIYPIYPGRTTFSGLVPGIDISIKEDPAWPGPFPHLDYAQIFVGPPPGVNPREQYDKLGGKSPIPEDNDENHYANIYVQVDNTTDFSNANHIRIRPVPDHPNPNTLNYIVIHGSTQIYISGSSLDSEGYSPWISDFSNETASGDWEVRVYGTLGGAPVGTFKGSVLELEP